MAKFMVNLQFKSCAENPGGDYTCHFTHDITPSTSPTTYPTRWASRPARQCSQWLRPQARAGS